MNSFYRVFLLAMCINAFPIFPQPISSIRHLESGIHRSDSSIKYPETSIKHPDYRNHLNIPEYDPSLIPLKSTRTGTGVWTELNPKVPRVDYLGVDFVDSLNGWTVGANGVILKTTDGGKTWNLIQSGVTNILTHVNSYNGNIVIAVAMGGKIIRSSDKGESWIEIASGTTRDLWRVQMINDTLGWISGTISTLLKTTDGGLNWQSVSTGFPQNYWSLSFLDEKLGYICCSNSYVLKTTNSGINWQPINIGDDAPLYCITVLDTQTVITGGFGRIASSYDGGNNWIISGVGAVSYSIAFSDSLNGIALNSMAGNYYKTNNRGLTWEVVDTIRHPNNWIDFVDENIGIAVGDGLNLQKTTNGGSMWQKLILNDDFNDVYFIDEMKGFAISFYSLYKTTDGGISWQKEETAPSGYDILFLDSTTGFICGQYILYKTTDGGEGWYPTNTLGLNTSKVFFINNHIGWTLSGGKILKTTDGGENWLIQLQANDAFTNIFFLDSLNGWATSRYIWQTTNGGTNWIQRTYLPNDSHDDVYFMNRDTGWIAMYSFITPSLYKTVDGGMNWSSVNDIVGASKFHYFIDSNHWMITGFMYTTYYVRKTYQTYDGGNLWIDISNDVPTGFGSFSAVSDNLGYAVGGAGLILSYNDTTYVPVELVSFEGKNQNDKIILTWITASELNNKGFYVERSFDKSKWQTIGFKAGKGTTTQPSYYNLSDPNIIGSILYYRLKQIDYNGSYSYSNVVEINIATKITSHELFQNFPNPFNPNARIQYNIPNDTKVELTIYDLLGRKVKTLVNEFQAVGRYNIEFNASNLASGVYIYQLSAKGFVKSRKMMVVK